MSDFKDFQKYFKAYQKRFGLSGYKVYFFYENIEGFADISVDHQHRVATVRLDKSKRHTECRSIVQSAKHEALHLLISRLEHLARERYVCEDEIGEACEEIVFKLEDLIGG